MGRCSSLFLVESSLVTVTLGTGLDYVSVQVAILLYYGVP